MVKKTHKEPISAHQKLVRLQKRIFNSLSAEARRLLGETPDSIKSYERETQSDFSRSRKRLTSTSKAELISAIRKADVTFIADYHTYDQAQRTAIRIMREVIEAEEAGKKPGESWTIGLELIPSQHQEVLDRFQEGELTLEKFHEIISYDEEWGFPWKHYEPIFIWAKDHGIRLIALNRPKALVNVVEKAELHERDQWAAGIITDFFFSAKQAKKKKKMIVLYGELHVGSRHLPLQLRKISRSYLKKSLNCISIHQNQESLYWLLAEQGKELRTEAVTLKKNVYCLFWGTPWAKLQSLVSWLEGEDSEMSEGELDYLSLIRMYGATIAEFLNLEVPSYEALSVKTIDEADFTDFLKSSGNNVKLTTEELFLIRFHVINNLRLYIPRAEIAYLGTPSQNRVAEMAAIHILRWMTKSPSIFVHETDDFFRQTLQAAFGFFGSLILNPRRKCDLLQDHVRRIHALEKGEARAVFPFELEGRRLAILLWNQQGGASLEDALELPELETAMKTRRLAPAAMIASTFCGQLLGKLMHQALLGGKIDIPTVQRLCLKRPSSPSARYFEKKYLELAHLCLQSVVECGS